MNQNAKRLHEKCSPREVVGPGTRYHHTPFARKLAENLIRRRISGLSLVFLAGNPSGGQSVVAASKWKMAMREGAGGGV